MHPQSESQVALSQKKNIARRKDQTSKSYLPIPPTRQASPGFPLSTAQTSKSRVPPYHHIDKQALFPPTIAQTSKSPVPPYHRGRRGASHAHGLLAGRDVGRHGRPHQARVAVPLIQLHLVLGLHARAHPAHTKGQGEAGPGVRRGPAAIARGCTLCGACMQARPHRSKWAGGSYGAGPGLCMHAHPPQQQGGRGLRELVQTNTGVCMHARLHDEHPGAPGPRRHPVWTVCRGCRQAGGRGR